MERFSVLDTYRPEGPGEEDTPDVVYIIYLQEYTVTHAREDK